MKYRGVCTDKGIVWTRRSDPHARAWLTIAIVVVALCMLLVFALATWSCAGNGHGFDEVAPKDRWGVRVVDESGNMEMVAGSDGCNDVDDCPAFQRYRRPAEDWLGGVRWLVSTSGRACLVTDAQFALANGWRGEYVRCNWRTAR